MFKLYFIQGPDVEKMVDEALARAAGNLAQLEHIHEVMAALNAKQTVHNSLNMIIVVS